jgi:hypothetical protein
MYLPSWVWKPWVSMPSFSLEPRPLFHGRILSWHFHPGRVSIVLESLVRSRFFDLMSTNRDRNRSCHPQELKRTEPDLMRPVSSVRSQSIDQSVPVQRRTGTTS